MKRYILFKITSDKSIQIFLEAMAEAGESFTSEDLNHLQNYDEIHLGIQRLTEQGRDSLFLITLEDTTEEIICGTPVVWRISEDKDSLVRDIQHVKNMLIPTVPIGIDFWSPSVKELLPQFKELPWLPNEFPETFEAVMRLRFPDEYSNDPEDSVKTILEGLSTNDNCIRMDYYYETDEVTMCVTNTDSIVDTMAWIDVPACAEKEFANVLGLIEDKKKLLS